MAYFTSGLVIGVLVGALVTRGGATTLVLVQDHLTDTDVLWCNFHALILATEFKCLLHVE